MQNDTSFARLVSLACHDVRTPLATVHGFTTTLARTTELAPPADRYVEMIDAASRQIAGSIAGNTVSPSHWAWMWVTSSRSARGMACA